MPPAHLAGDDADETYQKFTELLRERADDDLRLVISYTPDDTDLYYLRGDLLADDLLPRFQALHDRALAAESDVHDQHVTSYGDVEAVVTIHENVILVQFRASDGRGLLVSVDRAGDALFSDIL